MEPYVYIIIAVAAALLIALVVLGIIRYNKKKKIEAADKAVDEKVEQSASKLALCFGGNDNIKQITTAGSRVTVLLEDPTKVNKEEINQELANVMFMGNKVVFVIGSKSEDFSNLLKENTGKTLEK